MENEITINIEQLLMLEDNSITDHETIRQIGLLSCSINEVSIYILDKLFKKVKSEFQFCALYPNIMKPLDILPPSFDKEFVNELYKNRIHKK